MKLMAVTPEERARRFRIEVIKDTCVLLIAAAVFVLGFGFAR